MTFGWRYEDLTPFSSLLGRTILAVKGGKVGDETIKFELEDGSKARMFHDQCCCECVYLQDVCGDWADIIGSPILVADESEGDNLVDSELEQGEESFTWTFYKLATIKGSIDLRWFGRSNGYYSESVNFYITKKRKLK